MKTLIQTSNGASLYVFEDAASVILHNDCVVVGELTIADLNAFNAELVEGVTPPPDWAGNKYRVQNGEWIDMTPERESQAAATQATKVREERNRRIAALDWTQGKDIPDSISGPAALVRQALRDVPSQEGFPWTIVWPDTQSM